jgi:hypothetical protein
MYLKTLKNTDANNMKAIPLKIIVCFKALMFSVICFAQETYSVTNLEVNDKNPHFGLAISNDGKVLITSYKTNKSGRVLIDGGEPILSLYEGDISSSGEITNVNPLHISKTEDVNHIVSATYSPEGKKLYVSTRYEKRRNKPKGKFKETNLHLEVADYTEGKGWSNFKVLEFCLPKYSYAHPTISADGKQLYFIANIKGQGKQFTRGKSDIYKVEIDASGAYGEPENVGVNVNTYAKEMFPYISNDNVLYFASNRPNGVGNYDIYKSEMDADGKFKKAKILPRPINSIASDICFVLTSTNTGYVTSKRKKGKGDDDIYYFVKQ